MPSRILDHRIFPTVPGSKTHSNSSSAEQLQAGPKGPLGPQAAPALPLLPLACPGSYQPTVDGDAFLGSLASSARSLQPLRASQVHKVKLGCEGLILSGGLGSIRQAGHLPIHLQPGTQRARYHRPCRSPLSPTSIYPRLAAP